MEVYHLLTLCIYHAIYVAHTKLKYTPPILLLNFIKKVKVLNFCNFTSFACNPSLANGALKQL
jgi:hypothetical protein